MNKGVLTSLFILLTLTACQTNPTKPQSSGGKPLDNVELNYPGITFTFPETGETYGSGEAFPPPRTIDCSKLKLNTNNFEDAIKAGALVVRIEAPPTVKRIVKNEEGKDVSETVNIKPVYGGVLALCNVSKRAVGPDSRSYRIRGLDEYLAKGRDGLVSVVGAVLSLEKKKEVSLGELFGGGLFSESNTDADRVHYSWMLWLSDRSATFSDYAAQVRESKTSGTP